jgi:hypothetical protein
VRKILFNIFALFLIVSIAFVIYGHIGKVQILSLIGFTFIFILGVLLMSSGINYQVGETITTTYNYNNDTLVSDTQTMTIEYDGFTHKTFGFYLAVLAGFGFAWIFLDYKSRGEE